MEAAIATIFLVRHGETEWNALRLAQGQADVALNDKGRRQAERVAAELARLPVTHVYTSDLVRAADTAAPIATTHGLVARTDAAFREIDQGDWEGLHVDEIKRRWPDIWGTERHYKARPGGESPAQVRARALAALDGIVRAHPRGWIVVVTHGGTMRWLTAEALGLDDEGAARLRGVANGGIVRIDAAVTNGRLRLSNPVRLDGKTTSVEDPND